MGWGQITGLRVLAELREKNQAKAELGGRQRRSPSRWEGMDILLAGPWLQGWEEGRKGSEHLSDLPPQWQLGKLEAQG